jgi:hypothetical protein
MKSRMAGYFRRAKMAELIHDVTDFSPTPDPKSTDYSSLHESKGTAIVIDHGRCSLSLRRSLSHDGEFRLVQRPSRLGG